MTEPGAPSAETLINGVVNGAIVGNSELADSALMEFAARKYPVKAMAQNLAAYVAAFMNSRQWPQEASPDAVSWQPAPGIDLTMAAAGRLAANCVSRFLANNIDGVVELLEAESNEVVLSEAVNQLVALLFSVVRDSHLPPLPSPGLHVVGSDLDPRKQIHLA